MGRDSLATQTPGGAVPGVCYYPGPAMNKLVVVVGIVLAAVAVFFVARYFLEEKEDLAGTWVLMEIEKGGEAISARQLAVKGIHFEKDVAVWIVLGPDGQLREVPQAYSADPNSNPRKIDLGELKGKMPTLGIYEI